MRTLTRIAAAIAVLAAFRYASWPGALVAGAGVYGLSLQYSRYRPCRTCKGTGKRGDIVSGRAFDLCLSCKGTGRHPRWGVRLFRRKTYQEIKAGKTGRNH